MAGAALPTKVCPTCGRTFAWRKKWARDWDAVVHCSDRCRASRGARETSADLEAKILALLAQRARGASICPSEVLPAEGKQDPARTEAVRVAARRLAHAGTLDILQRGAVVDPDRARGPIRLRLRP